jgi:hypothetical protein
LNPPYEWETNWNPAVISGDRFVVTNPADGGRGFFRLKR